MDDEHTFLSVHMRQDVMLHFTAVDSLQLGKGMRHAL